MGLLNKRTINKAKALAEKNKDKIAAGVNKATNTIDNKTGGKHADKLKKLDDAAAKFAGNEPEAEPDQPSAASPGSDERSDVEGDTVDVKPDAKPDDNG
jgi:hypothetical protein